jgi:hypothetical protein
MLERGGGSWRIGNAGMGLGFALTRAYQNQYLSSAWGNYVL